MMKLSKMIPELSKTMFVRKLQTLPTRIARQTMKNSMILRTRTTQQTTNSRAFSKKNSPCLLSLTKIQYHRKMKANFLLRGIHTSRQKHYRSKPKTKKQAMSPWPPSKAKMFATN